MVACLGGVARSRAPRRIGRDGPAEHLGRQVQRPRGSIHGARLADLWIPDAVRVLARSTLSGVAPAALAQRRPPSRLRVIVLRRVGGDWHTAQTGPSAKLVRQRYRK